MAAYSILYDPFPAPNVQAKSRLADNVACPLVHVQRAVRSDGVAHWKADSAAVVS